jgi:toxin ParE1/3/4
VAKYILSNEAKEDLIRIVQYGVTTFGETQAEKYYNTLFEHFELIAVQPFAFESAEYIKPGYRRCVCGSGSIFYKAGDGIVEIMAIISKQDLNNIR